VRGVPDGDQSPVVSGGELREGVDGGHRHQLRGGVDELDGGAGVLGVELQESSAPFIAGNGLDFTAPGRVTARHVGEPPPFTVGGHRVAEERALAEDHLVTPRFGVHGDAPGVAAGVGQLAFSPDGSMLAVSHLNDGSPAESPIRLVDVATRQPVGDALIGLPGFSFSPDGNTLVTQSATSTLLWSLDPAIWRERACEITGRSLTDAEMHEYLPNEADPSPTCPRFPAE
jgi:hypothetical protein